MESIVHRGAQPSPTSSPELNPLRLGDRGSRSDNDTDTDSDVLAPLPEYKAAGETVLDFDGLLRPAPALRLREDLTEGCGGQTWPAGMVLARHLLRHRRAEMETARILELGSGGGLVGLALALACRGSCSSTTRPDSSSIFVTDQEPMLSLMKHNIALNGLQDRARAVVLNWGDVLPEEVRALRPNVVLAADCIYFEPAFPLLMATLEELLQLGEAGEPVTVYFSFKKRRRADMQFVKKAQKRFCVTDLADEDRPVFSRQGLFLYSITRKGQQRV
ncbi:hypothetical protein CMQ_1320 [Grosmannia clavigera kw1407]|uniref:Protein-lysine N-methyltransferase EFM6 n=1 Tax=Grosmannia clavigera (strain kw1407 / UAMH 11150) TaxID=655863 RepID=F0XCP8_GROCL|nr:uncharacterized protein CMQ_1320 [Grosmannia clavigera kw1407]EFX04392.1 hypothetical protein CMQ_1320 [Grosmannia clavigera kw1407]